MTDTESFQVFEEEPDHKFRTEIPNIVFELGLDSSEIALYSYYKKVSGDKGCCNQSRETIRKKIGVSTGKQKQINQRFRRSFDVLGGKSLIRLFHSKKENGESNTAQVLIVDIWRENGNFFRNKKSNTPPPHGVPQPYNGAPPPPHGAKEDPFKNIPFKKDNVRTPPPSAMDEKKPPQKDRFVNKLNPDQRKLHDQIILYKPQCGEAPDSDSVCAWFLDKNKHGYSCEQTTKALIVFRQDEADMSQKGQNIASMAAYLLAAIKSSRKPRNAAYDANKQMATLACKEFTDIRILDKYVSYMFGNDEITINYDLPMSTFIDCLGKAKQKIQMQKEYV